MVLPVQERIAIFEAISASKTTELKDVAKGNLIATAQSIILEIVGASTPNWALDIQGKSHPDGTYTNLDYQQIWQAGAAALANAQLTVNDTTRRFYIIPNPPPFIQLVSVRTAGTLTVLANYTSQPAIQWLLTSARGSTFVEGPDADNAAAAGNPVQMGGVVDETTPTARDEGDIVPNRMSAEGDQMSQPAFEGASIANADGIFSQGPAASDAPETGNPVHIGGSIDNTSPASGGEGDVRRLRASPGGIQLTSFGHGLLSLGNATSLTTITAYRDLDDTQRRLVTASYLFAAAPDSLMDRLLTLGDTAGAGLGVLAVGARTPNSSEVKTLVVDIGATSASRATLITPTSGKKIRILRVRANAINLTTDPDEVQLYFGTGAAITTNSGTAISGLVTGAAGSGEADWGEGAGPIGAADAVVSGRTETETETILRIYIDYREE